MKGKQPALLEDVSLYFQDFSKGLPSLATRDKDHGRMEKREYRLLTDLPWLPERSDWSGLKAVGSVRSTVTRNGTTSIDTRFFINSLTDINRFSYAVRKYWAIENQLHWPLDVIFDEDSSRARKDFSHLRACLKIVNTPKQQAFFRHTALNFLAICQILQRAH